MPRTAAGFLPPIALDAASGTPMYHQLSDWFRRAIVDGQLRPGQRIPSTRNLASELNVSRIPVMSAYEQLCAEGYLEPVVGAGTRVARSIPDEALRPVETKVRRSAPQVRPDTAAGVDPIRRISRRAEAMRGPVQTWLSSQGAFRVGEPALDQFPNAVWAKLVSRQARRLRPEHMGYGEPMGLLPFREAIAEYLRTVRGVRCESGQVLVTTGAQQGLQIAAHVLLDPGERAWLEEPGYPGARQALMTAAAKLIPVPVDHEGLNVAEGIRRGRNARVVYTTPSNQFPLGAAMSATRRMQLLTWAARTGAWIVEDDYDSEYRFGGRPIAALQGLDADARVIHIGTLSKVMFPALRLGYLVVPKDLVPAFAAARDTVDTFSSTLFQLAMTEFIREGHFARHIRRMRILYAERRAALLAAIHRHMGARLEVMGGDAGMQLAALFPPGVDDVAVSVRAAQRGVSARPLSPCYLNPPARGGLILGYGGASVLEIEEGIRRLVPIISANS
jgi:GntR family transcriptional regulator/MocR family aminotransferase